MLTNCSLDRHEFFKTLVSKAGVPNYSDATKKPVCWRVIDEKLDKNMYASLRDFEIKFISHIGYNISYLIEDFYFY